MSDGLIVQLPSDAFRSLLLAAAAAQGALDVMSGRVGQQGDAQAAAFLGQTAAELRLQIATAMASVAPAGVAS